MRSENINWHEERILFNFDGMFCSHLIFTVVGWFSDFITLQQYLVPNIYYLLLLGD